MIVESKQVQEAIKKNKRNLIVAILFLILSIGLFLGSYFVYRNNQSNVRSFHEVIANNDNREDVLVEVEVSEIPIVFAQYSSDKKSDKYYFLMDDTYMYIGYLSYDTFSKLNREDISDKPIKVRGYTKGLTLDVIELIVKVYNKKLGEDFLTLENYSDYVGILYLDETEFDTESLMLLVLGFVSLSVGIFMVIVYFKQLSQIKKIISSYTIDEWNLIEKEMNENQFFSNSKLNFYLTDNYIVDINRGLDVIRYSDIIWIYPYQIKQRGMITSQSLIVYTKDRKKHILLSNNSASHKKKKLLDEVMNLIFQKNVSILVGYTKENKKQVRELY